MRRFMFSTLAAMALASSAGAAPINLITTADGAVQDTSGPILAATNTAQTITASTAGGGVKSVLVFEFNLSSIDDNSIISSAIFKFISATTPSSSVSATVPFFVDVYAGDGSVNVADFTATALFSDNGSAQGFLSQSPSVAGTEISVNLSGLSLIQGLLASDLLTVRLEVPGLFQQVAAATLENTTYGAASLLLDATVAQQPPAVPLPAGLPLLLAGLGALGLVRRKRV